MTVRDILGGQLLRFGLVGVCSNGLLFALYLFLTEQGVGSKLAMTCAYGIGVALGYCLNKKWTFSHNGRVIGTFFSYLALYAVGYILNLLILFLMVDRLGFLHQWVQGGAILFLATFFFIAQKFFIFK